MASPKLIPELFDAGKRIVFDGGHVDVWLSDGRRDDAPAPRPAVKSALRSDSSGDADSDPVQLAELMADVLGGLFGDDALAAFQTTEEEEQGKAFRVPHVKAWDELAHPRGANGRFIPKGSAEAQAAAKQGIDEIRKLGAGGRTPEHAKKLADHLSILTVKQLHELKKEYGLKASGRIRDELVAKLIDRLPGAQERIDTERKAAAKQLGLPAEASIRDIVEHLAVEAGYPEHFLTREELGERLDALGVSVPVQRGEAVRAAFEVLREGVREKPEAEEKPQEEAEEKPRETPSVESLDRQIRDLESVLLTMPRASVAEAEMRRRLDELKNQRDRLAGKAEVAKAPSTPAGKQRQVIANALQGALGDKAEEAARRIGLSLNKYHMERVIREVAGLPPTEDVMPLVRQATQEALAHLKEQGIPAPPEDVLAGTGGPPKTDEEVAKEREQERQRWKQERAEKLARDKELAEKVYKKPPPAETVTAQQWIAIRTRQEIDEVNKDLAKIQSIVDLERRLARGEGTREDAAQLDAIMEKPATRRLLNKYRPGWVSDRKRRVSIGEAHMQAEAVQRSLKSTWEERGYLSEYSDTGAKAKAQHSEAVKQALLSGSESVPDEVLRDVLYEDWVPKQYRERGVTKDQIRMHQHYMGTEYAYHKGQLDAAMKTASEKLDRIIEKAGASPLGEIEARHKELSDLNRRLDEGRERVKRFEKPYADPNQPGTYYIPADKMGEYDALHAEVFNTANTLRTKRDEYEKANREDGHKWLKNLLPEGGNDKATIPHADFLNDRGKAELAKANEFLQSAVGKSWGALPAKLVQLDGSTRAYCAGNDITIQPHERDWVMVHEYGHMIEHQMGGSLGMLSKAFAMSELQRKGETPQFLGAGYEPHEIGARDDFMDSYTGKFYNHDSSEVLSMGIQHLYEDPVAFYRKAPEHFKYTLAALHGLLV